MNEQIDRICNGFIEGGGVGASCLVYKDGRELYSGCFGFADREAGTPMRRDSVCRLFSLTKPVTSAAAMILCERGLISPDDPVSRFFPEYAHMTRQDGDRAVPCGQELKISHLLTMTSGLPYPNNYDISVRGAAALFDRVNAGINGGIPVTTAEFTSSAAAIPLSFEAGTRWDYGISAGSCTGTSLSPSAWATRAFTSPRRSETGSLLCISGATAVLSAMRRITSLSRTSQLLRRSSRAELDCARLSAIIRG